MGFFEASSWTTGRKPLPILPKCGQCGLFKQCQSPKMAVSGRGTRRVLVVGEAPGKDEDEQGTHFVGEAGQTLRTIFEDVGCDLEECWKTNAVICRPDGMVNDTHIDACQPNLLNTIRHLKPNVVILLGPTAVDSLLSVEWAETVGSITRWAGWTIPSPMFGAWICPTYHPSFINRSNKDPALVLQVKAHIQKALSLEHTPVEFLTEEKLGRKVVRIENIPEYIEAMERLATMDGILAVDFETTGLKPEREEQQIVSCSFSLNGEWNFAGPVDESCYPALRRIATSQKLRKVASHMKFEERWSRKKLGVSMEPWYWDTMIAAHILDNREGITSIKFQGFVRFGIGGGPSSIAGLLEAPNANALNRIREVPLRDLLLYDGLDGLVEYLAMVDQRKEMGLGTA